MRCCAEDEEDVADVDELTARLVGVVARVVVVVPDVVAAVCVAAGCAVVNVGV